MTAPPSPHWDLSTIYPDLDSPEYAAAVAGLSAQIAALEALFDGRIAGVDDAAAFGALADLLAEVIDRFNGIYELFGTIRPYVYSFVATDSRHAVARRRLSELDPLGVRLRQIDARFQTWLGRLAPVLETLIAAHPTVAAHAFTLRETAEQSRYLMSEAEESLAAALNVSGANAWNKLQGTLTSQLNADFELDGELRRLPLPAIINLRSHPSEDVRRRAWQAELDLLHSARETLAACLNGVKGAVNTLNRKRGRQDALHSAIDAARMDRPTLEALLGAMHDSLPTFRRYFQAKARRLGKSQLDWWDLSAPTGNSAQQYTFDAAAAFIVANFAGFSADLAAFAQHAFDHNWIDAEPRDGKRAGAFCMGVYGPRESRILSNFDGTLDQVSTIAHELGHGYHNHCLYTAGKTPLQSSTPMTLAETASIMCETIVMQAALERTADPADELAILETMLIGDAQVIVDIYARYLFEREVFERREAAELSAEEFCALMTDAQRAAYGDGVNSEHLHPYLWGWKPHFYYAGLSFYNFPYAFGLLFGAGLYAVYQERGAAFVDDYRALLASTGEATAAELAARFGIDIRARAFWDAALDVIGRRIDRYCAL